LTKKNLAFNVDPALTGDPAFICIFRILVPRVQFFIEIHKLQAELGVFEARGVANFGTRCTC